MSRTYEATATPIVVGLRIDVDTYRGTRLGVPALVEILAEFDIRASFFFTVGPDNMGRHLWRLLKPAFLIKMLRSKAASLYGWDILLRGTFWPGTLIGKNQADIIRATRNCGHEMGLHAWDHHSWQVNIDRYTPEKMLAQLQQGFDQLSAILGAAPTCSAAAGWRCNELALKLKERFNFLYNSDCRGTHLFRPQVDGRCFTPQIPVTLPTYDEVIGQNGISDANYNDFILKQFLPDRLNVYTIHAEVEGIAKQAQFAQLLACAKERGIVFQTLGGLLPADIQKLPAAKLVKQTQLGREGWLAQQGADISTAEQHA